MSTQGLSMQGLRVLNKFDGLLSLVREYNIVDTFEIRNYK